jgi:hypothetical protein
MLRNSIIALFTLCLIGAGLSQPVAAQSPGRALSLFVKADGAVLDAEALRVQLERELALPVERVAEPSGSHLSVEADSLAAVRVMFVREDASTVERTLDVSSTGAHALETVALLAANLVRDEAAALLESLRATPPPVAAVPAVAAASAPPALPVPPPPPPPPGCAPNQLEPIEFGIDLLPYVGTSSRKGTQVQRTISFNVLGGVTGAVRGIELGGFFNYDDHSVCGLQLAGIANLVNGPVQGVQLGFIDWAGGRLDGAQFGLVDVTFGTLTGAQLGLVDVAAGDIAGAQLGLANVGGGSLDGAQLGLANIAATRVRGAQLGLANVSGGEVRGTQLGLANVSGGELHGFQAGLVNVANGRVSGAMLGLVNVAADADAAIGLVSVLWRGRTHLDVWGTDSGIALVGVEHGGRYLHNIYGVGFTFRESGPVFAASYGIGARVFNSTRCFVDIDAMTYAMFVHDDPNNEIDYAMLNQLRVPIGFRILPEVAVFVGPAFNVSVAEGGPGNLLADPSLYGSSRASQSSSDVTVRLWPGFTVGARFF